MGKGRKGAIGPVDKGALASLMKKARRLDGRTRSTGEVHGIARARDGASTVDASIALADFGFVVHVWQSHGSPNDEEAHVGGIHQAERFIVGAVRRWNRKAEEEGKKRDGKEAHV